MGNTKHVITDTEMERRKFRDRCAIAAMQSLIQVYAIVNDDGYGVSAYYDPADFQSKAGIAIENGWSHPLGYSVASSVAIESFTIATAMLSARDAQDNLSDEDFIEEDGDAEATEEATSS